VDSADAGRLRVLQYVFLTICARHYVQVQKHVDDCVSKGAKVLLGGKPHEALNAKGGSFYEPTVLAEVTKDMLPYKEETFGPTVPLIRFETEQEGIDMANDTE
jgi:succinate-semialdehyde dehydrogenase/glutarate-semialdehyde dehydrogenase